jgi:pimeloyl-ACP methyl ester carboxylesterase
MKKLLILAVVLSTAYSNCYARQLRLKPSIQEILAVPDLTDETAEYKFSTTRAGTIIYSGSCGEADLSSASVGENTINWVLSDGSYDDCTIKVRNAYGNSNTINVPAFHVTSHYPVVLVHGLFGNGPKAWGGSGGLASTLINHGWPESLIYYPSIQTNNGMPVCGNFSPTQSEEVAGWVDQALSQHPGFDKVDLVGHSRGGANIINGLAYGKINPDKVRYVVTLSGVNYSSITQGIPCYKFYDSHLPADETPGDALYTVYFSDPGDPEVTYAYTHIDGADNINLINYSHAQMRTAQAVQLKVVDALNGLTGGNQ